MDFGTTNSVVSIFNFKDGEAQTIPIDGANIFPTAVQFEPDPDEPGKLSRVFGAEAKEAAAIFPASTVLSVKRLLGSDEKIVVEAGGEEHAFTPAQIAGEILGCLKRKADEYAREELGIPGEFSGCVITVPANSTDKQKRVTKEAAVLAGFDEDSVYLRLEPAAAAISYAIGESSAKKVLIYDFGGGTFDACILDIDAKPGDEPVISVASTYGDNRLGGDDADALVMDIIYEEFKNLTNGEIDIFDEQVDDGVSRRQKKTAQARLRQAANVAKERLSQAKSAKVTLSPFLQEPIVVSINMEITREQLETHARVNRLGQDDVSFGKFEGKTLSDMVDSTLACVDKCLEAAGLSAGDIDEVFLVGGSSAIPLAANRVEEKFGRAPYKSKVSPALSISRGAAVYCEMIMMPDIAEPIVKVKERTIHPLGLELHGRRFLKIVDSGMDIPPEGLTVECPETLTTGFDNLSSMAIVVYENTAPATDGSPDYVYRDGMKRLSGTSLRGIPQGPKGQERVRVVFSVGQDNMLRVMAESLSAGGLVTELTVDDLY